MHRRKRQGKQERKNIFQTKHVHTYVFEYSFSSLSLSPTYVNSISALYHFAHLGCIVGIEHEFDDELVILMTFTVH